MQNKHISFAALLVALVAGSAFAERATARTFAEVYWRCPSGYAFETSGSAVHCKKPQWTETKPFMACAPGLGLNIDNIGTTDMCAGTNPLTGTVSIEPPCYPTDVANGFTKRKVSGKDFCGKTHPAEIMAPSQAVTL